MGQKKKIGTIAKGVPSRGGCENQKRTDLKKELGKPEGLGERNLSAIPRKGGQKTFSRTEKGDEEVKRLPTGERYRPKTAAKYWGTE